METACFRSFRKPFLIMLLLSVITAGIFWKVGGYDFLTCDDNIHIYENPLFREITLSNVGHFWKEPYVGMYAPFSYTVWALQAKLSAFAEGQNRLDPHIFHSANLVFHIASALIVFLILRSLFKNDPASCLGALIFALHPVQVEAVAWISELRGVLGGFLSLVAIWQYLSYLNKGPGGSTGKQAHYLISLIAFTLALLSKPSCAATPFVAAIIAAGMMKRPLREIFKDLLPWVLIIIPVAVMTKISQPDTIIKSIPPLWLRPLIAGDAVMFYLYKLVLPYPLSIDYGRTPAYVLGRVPLLLAALVPYLTFAFLWVAYRRAWILVPMGIFASALLPVSGLTPFVFQNVSTVADRYLYLAMLGPAMLTAALLANHRRRAAFIIAGAYACLLGTISFYQADCWQNTFTLFDHALIVNRNSELSHINLGEAYYREQKLGEAIRHYTMATEINPRNAWTQSMLGLLYLKSGKPEEATGPFSRAVQISPANVNAHKNLCRVLMARGKMDEAEKVCTAALKINPHEGEVHRFLACILDKKGRPGEARLHRSEADRLLQR
jgi:protein O-mannosyl-transferase